MSLTADALVLHCRQSLANYKVPRHMEFSETDLPKSGSERYSSGYCVNVSGPVQSALFDLLHRCSNQLGVHVFPTNLSNRCSIQMSGIANQDIAGTQFTGS